MKASIFLKTLPSISIRDGKVINIRDQIEERVTVGLAVFRPFPPSNGMPHANFLHRHFAERSLLDLRVPWNVRQKRETGFLALWAICLTENI